MQPGFQTQLYTRSFGKRIWILTKDLVYYSKDNKLWTIPEGFACDLYSSPRIVWWYVPPSIGYYDMPAVLHDFLFRCRKLLNITSKQADDYFYESLLLCDTNKHKAKIMRSVVRLHSLIVRDGGNGISDNKQYNLFLPNGMTLQEWVLKNYSK